MICRNKKSRKKASYELPSYFKYVIRQGLFYWNLIYSVLMTSAFKFSIEEFGHYLVCHISIDKSAWHNKYVCIIMLA